MIPYLVIKLCEKEIISHLQTKTAKNNLLDTVSKLYVQKTSSKRAMYVEIMPCDVTLITLLLTLSLLLI